MVEMITQDGNVYTFPIFSAEPYYSQLRAQCFLELSFSGQQSGSMQKLKKANQKLLLYRKHLTI